MKPNHGSLDSKYDWRLLFAFEANMIYGVSWVVIWPPDHLSKAVENFPFTPALPGTKAASLIITSLNVTLLKDVLSCSGWNPRSIPLLGQFIIFGLRTCQIRVSLAPTQYWYWYSCQSGNWQVNIRPQDIFLTIIMFSWIGWSKWKYLDNLKLCELYERLPGKCGTWLRIGQRFLPLSACPRCDPRYLHCWWGHFGDIGERAGQCFQRLNLWKN